jgi:hypothetical protein
MRSNRMFAATLGICWVVSALLAPRVVLAQEPPKLAVGGAIGLAMPFYADFDFDAPEWQISIRTAVSDHVLLEGFFDEWRHSIEDAQENIVLRGPDEVIGRAARIGTRTVHRVRSFGINGLMRGSFDRVTLTGGGGIGVWLYDRHFSQTVTGCQTTVPNACQDWQNDFSNGSFSAQGVAGVEVALAPRLAAFGQYQLTVPLIDLAAAHSSVAAGVRLRVW